MIHFWQSFLYPFLNSSFFIALITLVVGAAAYIIYKLQQKDKKREAANIILLEIQGAERKLQQIKESLVKDPPTLPNDLRLLPTENWSRYSYLFIRDLVIRDLDRDEWDSIVDFYTKCSLIDETIKYNNLSFWNDVEQIRSNKQRILADFSRKTTEKLTGTADVSSKQDVEAVKAFDDLTEKFDKIYMSKQGRFGYTPQKTTNDAKLYIESINLRISQSNTGSKLKKLAGTNL